MSRSEQVLAALAVLLTGGAWTFERNNRLPEDIPPGGLLILHDGEPGEPEVSMSPLTYYYEHRAEIDVFVRTEEHRDAAFDAVKVAIGRLITANRTLGGLCDWIEAEAPAQTDLPLPAAEGIKAAIITVVLHYTTTDPLG